MIELITGVVTDIDNHILLAQSRNHGWWELPGTKLEEASPSPEAELAAAFQYKLGLEIARTKQRYQALQLSKNLLLA